MQISFENVASFFVGAASAMAVLRAVAPHTSTPKDDAMVAKADELKAWVEKKAPAVWAVVEVAGKMGTLPAGVSKAIYFVEKIKEAWDKAHNCELPKDIEAVAMKIASEISRSAKQQ